jgi:hypothetical protein
MNWQQLKAILWLRWRLTRNQFARAGKLNAVLSILMLVMMGMAVLALAAGGVVGGYFAGSKAPPEMLMLIWDGVICAFLFIWLSGLMVEIQRSETIDLSKLLHLPVTLQQVFGLNYVASHFTPSLGLFLPAMLGLCAGVTVGAGPRMALMFPLVLSFIFMLTSWTYCLRGWLAALMVNKRRRRTIIVWITIFFVVLGQLPNLIFNSPTFRKQNRTTVRSSAPAAKRSGGLSLPEQFVDGHVLVPPGWVGYGALGLRERTAWPAVAATVASCLIGALGLSRAYRMTMRFYEGVEGGSVPKALPARAAGPRAVLLVERRLPLIPDDTAALALATLRSLLRTPELKMAFIMPVVIGALMSSGRFSRTSHPMSETVIAFIALGAVVLASFSFSQSMANMFGLDRNGFRALVLLPTRRHHILLAKNLAFFPFSATVATVLLVLVKLLMHMSWSTMLMALLQVPLAFMLFCLLCNMVSILAPYRMSAGTLKAKKPKAIVFVAVFATMLLTPVVLLPILIPQALQLLFSFQGWVPWLPVNFLSSAILLALIGCLYWVLLPLQGQLLQRRELAILKEVTEEVE